LAEDEISKKLRYLRSNFGDEVKKTDAMLKSGSGADDVYCSRWKFFSSLQFLKKHIVRKPQTTTNLVVCFSVF